jgi:hypothetical protein
MSPDPEVPPGSASRRADYEHARDDADAAEEAVGDAEDQLVVAERTLSQHRPAEGEDQRAEREADVEAAEGAWHERRHEAYTAAQERDRAREQLDDDGA